jgi:hypothetical protein
MLVVGTVVVLGQAVTTTSAHAVQPSFVTILFSRSQWAIHENCNVLPGAITLQTIASDLHDRGGIGTGSVVTSWIRESSIHCTRAALYPSLDTLRQLHRDYGWEATSHSATYPNMTTLTRSQQIAESCGTLPTFVSHGFNRAWGTFSYPNNKRSDVIQTDVLSTCFAFGRKYSPNQNTIGRMAAPWWAKVKSVNGGKCNDVTAPCSSIGARYRYVNPYTVASLVAVSPGEWAVAQFHKTGERIQALGGGPVGLQRKRLEAAFHQPDGDVLLERLPAHPERDPGLSDRDGSGHGGAGVGLEPAGSLTALMR